MNRSKRKIAGAHNADKKGIAVSLVLLCALNAFGTQSSTRTLEAIEVSESADDGYRAKYSEIGKINAPILEIPQTVNVVTQQQLKDKKPETLAESLQNVSGISYGNTLGGIFDSIKKRGFGDVRDGSIMRNGVPSSVMSSFNKTVESVEVLKGANGLLYGAQQPGGVINMVTKKPQLDFQNELWAGIGNRNYWNVGFDSTGQIGDSNFAYRLIYDQSAKDYWRNFGEYQNALFAPSIAYIGDDYRFDVAYTHVDNENPVDRGFYIYPATGRFLPITNKKERLDEPFNQLRAKIDTLDIGFEKHIGEDWLLRGQYALTRSKHKYGHIRLMTYNPATNIATRRNELWDNFIHKTQSGSLTLNGIADTYGIEHSLLLGIDAKKYERRRPGGRQADGSQYNINVVNPIYGTVGLLGDSTRRQATIQDQTLKTIGAYVQDNINLTNELILSLGVRYEYYDMLAFRRTNGTVGTDQHDGKWTWQAGLLYLLTPEWSVYTSYAQSFSPQLSFDERADASQIKPEEGDSVEFGTKFQNDNITATMAVFNIDKKNIMRLAGGAATPVGDANSRGFEFDFNGRVTQGLSLGASYAYTKTRYKSDGTAYALINGKQLESTPKHQASLFGNYDLTHLGIKGLRVGGGARYFGSWQTYYMGANTTVAPRGTAYKIPHAVIYDAFVSYDTRILGYATNFAFNVKNLTDKLYFTSSSMGTDASVLPVQSGYARQFMLTASVKF